MTKYVYEIVGLQQTLQKLNFNEQIEQLIPETL